MRVLRRGRAGVPARDEAWTRCRRQDVSTMPAEDEEWTTLAWANASEEGNSSSTILNLQEVCDDSQEGVLASPAFHALVYIMYGSIFAVALLGNGLVCFVVYTSPRMKTVTNYFIVNLAVGDVLMTLFCVPFSFVIQLVLRRWPFGLLMCKLVNFSQTVSVLVSAYTMLAISIDRYMAIMRPLRPRLGSCGARLVVGAVWAGALATAAPLALVSQLGRPTEWHRACRLDVCVEAWSEPEANRRYTTALLALQFALPLCALVCTYARIAHAVWGKRPPGEAQSLRDSRMHHSKRKMVKMMIMVVAAFTISWLPLNIFLVVFENMDATSEWAKWPGFHYIWFATHWLAMSHCCCNPLIYCYMNSRYRRGFRQVLCWLWCTGQRRGRASATGTGGEGAEGVPLSELVAVRRAHSWRRAATTSTRVPQGHGQGQGPPHRNHNSLKNYYD